jgi:hypothetical protein
MRLVSVPSRQRGELRLDSIREARPYKYSSAPVLVKSPQGEVTTSISMFQEVTLCVSRRCVLVSFSLSCLL